MKSWKKTMLVLRAGMQETYSDRRIVVLFLIIGFVLDNGVRRMVNNAVQVGEPLGVFEGFLMCVNHWYYLIPFLIGFVFILSGVPRIDSEQVLLIYRTGKRNWLLGEILQIMVCAVVYVLMLLAGCMISCAKYCYAGNVWSNFTVDYKAKYEALLSDNNRFVDQQVFRYYPPYQAVVHSILLLVLCLTLMGTIVLFFTIVQNKLAGIVLNIVFILFVLIFNKEHAGVMWLSPFCHAVIALHNQYVFREYSVPLFYSYLYLLLWEGVMIGISSRKVGNKIW